MVLSTCNTDEATVGYVRKAASIESQLQVKYENSSGDREERHLLRTLGTVDGTKEDSVHTQDLGQWIGLIVHLIEKMHADGVARVGRQAAYVYNTLQIFNRMTTRNNRNVVYVARDQVNGEEYHSFESELEFPAATVGTYNSMMFAAWKCGVPSFSFEAFDSMLADRTAEPNGATLSVGQGVHIAGAGCCVHKGYGDVSLVSHCNDSCCGRVAGRGNAYTCARGPFRAGAGTRTCGAAAAAVRRRRRCGSGGCAGCLTRAGGARAGSRDAAAQARCGGKPRGGAARDACARKRHRARRAWRHATRRARRACARSRPRAPLPRGGAQRDYIKF
ncbi:hypothetical protein FGB62_43g012 [Gracilaria domingensis]|nr:hypothetical protein FGB62_43g012 [Gracilaria domingensis]